MWLSILFVLCPFNRFAIIMITHHLIHYWFQFHYITIRATTALKQRRKLFDGIDSILFEVQLFPQPGPHNPNKRHGLIAPLSRSGTICCPTAPVAGNRWRLGIQSLLYIYEQAVAIACRWSLWLINYIVRLSVACSSGSGSTPACESQLNDATCFHEYHTWLVYLGIVSI